MSMWDQGVTPESPAGAEGFDSASSAGTQNTETVAPSQVQQSIPYERFKEVNDGYRSEAAARAAAEQRALLLEQQHQQTSQRLQQLERQLTTRANTPSRTPEEERGRQQALQALRELQQEDPDYARIANASKAMPAVAQALITLQQQVSQSEQRAAQAFGRGEEGRLYQMATSAGMTFKNPQEFGALNDYVAGIIRSDPQAMQRFLQGDPSVMPAAFAVARQHYDNHARAAREALANTKANVQRLPPRIGGGTPGSPPPPSFDPKDPRGSMAKIHAAAEAALQSSLG